MYIFVYALHISIIRCGRKRNFFVTIYIECILSSGEHFVVKATGDSMVGAGIEDGDYIVVKAQPVADNGQIVVALIDDEVTIKRFFRDDKNKKIVLHPENDAYSDILCDNIEIQGIAVNIIKSI